MGSPSVSVIIVNWNGEPFIPDCFKALAKQTFQDFEVIFVDNGSSDNSVTLARKVAEDLNLAVKIIKLPTNTGFTGGNIAGLKKCSGKFIALLNNDTVVSPQWLEALAQAMEAYQDVGICASKLVVDGKNIIDSSGDGYSTFGSAFKRGEGFPASQYESQEYVFGACAGAALYRRQMLDEIGFLDDDFFLYFEDVDLNFRAQLAGWKCIYVPKALVRHKVNASSKLLGDLATYYGVRNDKVVKIKNIPYAVMLRHLPAFILNELISLQYHIRIGRFRSYLKGNLEFFRNLPFYLKKRKQTMKLKKVSNSYIEGLLTSGFSVYLGLRFYRLKEAFGKRRQK